MEMDESDPRTDQVEIGVVTGGGDVLWIGAAATRRALVEELAESLLDRCHYQLKESDARQFRRLFAQGQRERAVDLYFESVDARWEVERLTIVTRTVRPSEAESAEHLVLSQGALS